MNQNPEQNTNRNSQQQRSSGNRTSNMTPEQRQEYLRRLEAQRRSQERQEGRRTSYRRRKRARLNIALTLFLVVICIILGLSFWQIAKNTGNYGSGSKDPNQNAADTGSLTETNAPEETASPETDPVETEETETAPTETEASNDPNTMFVSHSVNSSDINAGDLILVNYQYAYSLADTVSVKNMYGNKTTSYGLSLSSHCLTERALNAMNKFADAFAQATECYELVVNSAYRSTADQQSIYDKRVTQYGEDYAKQYVAQTGYSEHHTGLAVDLTFYSKESQASFSVDAHPNGSWLPAHCAEYGFIIRYPDNKSDITKISYEPWHFRFVGKPHAAIITKSGLCMEEYIGLIKNYTLDTKLLHALEDGTTAEANVLSIPSEGYIIYYVPASAEAKTEIKIPKGYEHYIVSGNNVDGFIVTVYVGQ